MDERLFSPDVNERYDATMAVNIELGRRWPYGCDGAANAFLTLIGPSPGRRTDVKATDVRPDGDPMTIGPEAMLFSRWSGKEPRRQRWTNLSASLLGGEQYVKPLTSVLNLDWDHAGDQRNVDEERMRDGFNVVWPLILEQKPRLICTVTKAVWRIVSVRIPNLAFAECPVADLPQPPVIFRMEGSDFLTMLIRPHNHPSRHFLTSANIATLGGACRWFLEEHRP